MRSAKALTIAIFLFSTAGSLAQTGPQAAFDKANTELENGNYNQALQDYKAILSSGNTSGALLLNMGIAATQIDSLGLAKYYLLRATAYPEISDEAVKALSYVDSQFSRQSATLPKLPWDRAVDWMKARPGAEGVFFTGMAFGLIALILILGNWFGFIRFNKQKQTLISCATACFLIVMLSFYVDYVDRRYDDAVLVDQEAAVLEQPSEDAALVSMAYEGYSLVLDHNISDRQADWYYIRLGNGQYGWIRTDGVKVL